MKDHLAKLVGIADQLGDPPFGLVHLRLALAFSSVVFWIIGHHRLSILEQKARIRPFGDSPNGFGDSQIFISSFFLLPLFLFDKISCSQYLLQMQVQAQPKFSNDLTQGFPVFSNRQLFQPTQEQKGILKACNRAECKVSPSVWALVPGVTQKEQQCQLHQ
ncbi:hypothetical protein H5410_021385, partial [Solanum commersonii]